jgi:hypothetical protein
MKYRGSRVTKRPKVDGQFEALVTALGKYFGVARTKMVIEAGLCEAARVQIGQRGKTCGLAIAMAIASELDWSETGRERKTCNVLQLLKRFPNQVGQCLRRGVRCQYRWRILWWRSFRTRGRFR